MADSTTTIAIVPADRDDRRLRVSMLTKCLDGSRLRLTDETYSDAVGWFAQGHVDLSPSQVDALRTALGVPQRVGRERPQHRAASAAQTLSARALDDGEPAATVLLSAYRAG